MKIWVTIIASLSAATIGLQTKLKWEQMSDKFEAISDIYNLLCLETFFEINELKIKYRLDFNQNQLSNQEMHLNSIRFIERTQKIENHIASSIAVTELPEWLLDVCNTRIQQKQDFYKQVDLAFGHQDKNTWKRFQETSLISDFEILSSPSRQNLPDSIARKFSTETAASQVSNYSNYSIYNLDINLYKTPLEGYTFLYQQLKNKQTKFDENARFYKLLDLLCFTLPLLILQFMNSILPTFLSHKSENARITTTVIACISAVFISVQGKLRLGEIGEGYEAISKSYTNLVNDSYFELKQCQVYMNSKIYTQQQLFEKLLNFISHVQTIEKHLSGNSNDGIFTSSSYNSNEVKSKMKKKVKEMEEGGPIQHMIRRLSQITMRQ